MQAGPPRQAGLDGKKFEALLADSQVVPGGRGDNEPKQKEWGAALTRGGCLVQTWGDPAYTFHQPEIRASMSREPWSTR